jgi:3-phosphoshikimate 1-carboxyvinyltransferase
MSKRVRSAAHENGTIFIRSYHDFEGTDSYEALKALVEKCRYHGADVVKLVTTAHSEEDVQRVMSLYEWAHAENIDLIAFCMGEAGRQSRLDCLKYGAPYTYAALSADEAAAPGQWPADEMRQAVYGGFKFIDTLEPLVMPVSKSFAQRAIIAAALAEGTSHLHGYTPCGDNEAALQVARNLGAEVDVNGTEVTIKGISASLGSLNMSELHVGESGLLTRMMIPVMAQLCAGSVTFTGEKTLLNRPLTGAREIMEAFEAEIDSINVPLTVKGPLKAGRAEISGKHGSQLISGLLMALPFADRNSSVIVKDPKSIPYMFITLEVLKKFGIKVGNDMLGGPDFLESGGDWALCTEMVFKVKGGQKYRAANINLEGDWSAAANFLVAGALFGRAELEGLDTTSLQADLSIMDILMDAGASLSQLDGDRGNITVQRAPLKAFSVDASNCPDLFPILAVLAAFCQGTSRLAGVGRLANKESDRAKAILEMLTQMGVKASIDKDELVIEGHTLVQRLMSSDPGLLKGGAYTSHHDHRMVMALKVASLGADSPITIDDEACVAKSFPQFHDIFARLAVNPL